MQRLVIVLIGLFVPVLVCAQEQKLNPFADAAVGEWVEFVQIMPSGSRKTRKSIVVAADETTVSLASHPKDPKNYWRTWKRSELSPFHPPEGEAPKEPTVTEETVEVGGKKLLCKVLDYKNANTGQKFLEAVVDYVPGCRVWICSEVHVGGVVRIELGGKRLYELSDWGTGAVKPVDETEVCAKRVKILLQLCFMYGQDWRFFPPAERPDGKRDEATALEAFQELIRRQYIDDPGVLVCPHHGAKPASLPREVGGPAEKNFELKPEEISYGYNPKLMSAGSTKATTPLIWDTSPHPEGRNVAFADGGVKLLSEEKFQALMAEQKIPEWAWKGTAAAKEETGDSGGGAEEETPAEEESPAEEETTTEPPGDSMPPLADADNEALRPEAEEFLEKAFEGPMDDLSTGWSELYGFLYADDAVAATKKLDAWLAGTRKNLEAVKAYSFEQPQTKWLHATFVGVIEKSIEIAEEVRPAVEKGNFDPQQKAMSRLKKVASRFETYQEKLLELNQWLLKSK